MLLLDRISKMEDKLEMLIILLIMFRQNREKLLNYMFFIALRYKANVNLYFSVNNKIFRSYVV